MEGSQFCFTHDPAKAAEREAASQRGGQTRAEQLSGAIVEKLETPEEVAQYLARVAADTERGLIPPKSATGISNVCRVQLQALKYAEAAKECPTYWYLKV